MKYLYLGLLILCLLLCACYLSNRQVQARIEAAALPLHRAMNAHRAGDGAARELAVRESLDRWKNSAPLLDSLLSHERTDQITDALEELQEADEASFVRLCHRALAQLAQLSGFNALRWENVF